MICKKCKHDSLVQGHCVLCGWDTPRVTLRKFFGIVSWVINISLGIIAAGLILRTIQKLFLLGWRLY